MGPSDSTGTGDVRQAFLARAGTAPSPVANMKPKKMRQSVVGLHLKSTRKPDETMCGKPIAGRHLAKKVADCTCIDCIENEKCERLPPAFWGLVRFAIWISYGSAAVSYSSSAGLG